MTQWISDQIFCCCIKQFEFISLVLTNVWLVTEVLTNQIAASCDARNSKVTLPLLSVQESRLRPLNRTPLQPSGSITGALIGRETSDLCPRIIDRNEKRDKKRTQVVLSYINCTGIICTLTIRVLMRQAVNLTNERTNKYWKGQWDFRRRGWKWGL